MQQLAIASVLPQTWSTPLEPAKGLQTGTIFQELDLPFYMADAQGSVLSEDSPATESYAKRFSLYDCMLYLDTHPADPEALKYYEQLAGHPYASWKESPLPWEGGDAACGAMKDSYNSL